MRVVVIGNAQSGDLNMADYIPGEASEVIFERNSYVGTLVESYADEIMLAKCGRPIPKDPAHRCEAYLSLAKKCDCLVLIYENMNTELALARDHAKHNGVRVIEHKTYSRYSNTNHHKSSSC